MSAIRRGITIRKATLPSTGLEDAFASLSVSPSKKVSGDTQAMRLAYAVQHPFDVGSVAKGGRPEGRQFTATDLLLASQNASICPVGRDPDEDRVVVRRELGRGANASVWLLERPASSKELGLGIDTGLALKENLVPIRVWDPKDGEEGSVDEQDAIVLSPCWDPSRRQYVCRIEEEAEVLISALASGLFTDGVTPGTVLQLASFTCAEPQNDGKLYMIQELLGLESHGYLINSLDRLPELLHALNRRKGGSEIVEATKFLKIAESGRKEGYDFEDVARYGAESEVPALTAFGRIALREISTEVLISVLHTIAVLQSAYGIVTLDTKLSNIMFKEFDRRPYFRNLVMTPDEVRYLRYDFTAPGEKGRVRSFWIPNRGWIPKVGDMGMAIAHRVPFLDGSRLEHTSIGFYRYFPDRFEEVQRRYRLGAAAVKDPNVSLRELSDLARSLGYSEEDAESAALEAKTTLMRADIVEYGDFMENRSRFGIHEEFSPGYDVHLFVASLARSMERWLKQSIDDPFHKSPITLLQESLNYTFPDPEKVARPGYEQVSPHGPLDALAFLHRVAERQVPEESHRMRGVAQVLRPYVTDPRVDPSRVVVVSVPQTPIIA
jgi:hypothetical protein